MRKLTLSSSLVVSCFLLSGSGLCAQGPSPSAGQYAAESFVIDRSDWLYSNNADGTGYREHTVAVTIQSEAALRDLGVVAIEFASASEHVDIHYARARHKDGSVTETPVSGVIEQPEEVTREAPFYSDLKQAQLPVKNLQVGDTLEWQARIVRTRAEAPGQFWGSDSFANESMVALEESVELRVPAASNAIVWTNPELGAPAVAAEGDTKVYRWKTAQLAATTGPAADLAKKAKKGKLLTAAEELDEEQGELPSMAWTSFKNWEAVGAWYRGLEGERAAPDDEIKAKVAELTAGKTTEEDKVRAVYAYVSAQVRYIGVAFGIGRFQPHEAADVLHSQYGDCKDKATLLAAMLGALGLHADSVLIGDGVRWNEAVPSPAAFNHLITRVKVGEEEVWLDATQEVAPYKVLLFELRDKEALVVPETGPATVERTPKDLPFAAFQQWKSTGKIDENGLAESRITMSLRGDDEIVLRAVMHQVAPAQYDEVARKLVESFGFQGTASHPEFSRAEDTTEPFTFSFDYRREKPGEWDSLRILPQLPPVSLPLIDEKDPPVATINLGTPRTEVSDAELKLPDGWGVELPEALHAKSDFATFDLTYRFDKGTIYVERKIVVLRQKIPASDWRTYKKWGDAFNMGYDSFIQLTTTGAKAGAMSSSRGGDSNTQVQDLFGLVEDAFKRKDAKAMDDYLKRIKKLDPKARRLLAWEAASAGMHNKYDEAIADNEKELELYPDELDRYGSILWFERRKNDKAAAEATLRQWAKAAPHDPEPLLELARLLLTQDRTDEAMAAAGEAVGRTTAGTPQGEAARFQLGQIQLKAGATDKGRETLVALLKSSDDAGILNDTAYELADAKLELPLDEASSRKSIAKLTEETSSWTLDEKPDTLKARTSLLTAAWDTLGWILYREGKYAEAESWLEAARLSRPSDVMRDHLKQERAALLAANSKAVDPDAGKTERDLRTLPLGPSGGRVGSAEYRMLVTHGRVERAELSGDEKLTGADEMLKTATLPRFFPTGSDAKLLLNGEVDCVAGACNLVLADP